MDNDLQQAPKYVHSMRKRSFLESALKEGLMLTDHQVTFRPAESDADFASLVYELVPTLQAQLAAIGAPWEQLPEERRRMLMSGIGSISGMIPMLCFTKSHSAAIFPLIMYLSAATALSRSASGSSQMEVIVWFTLGTTRRFRVAFTKPLPR